MYSDLILNLVLAFVAAFSGGFVASRLRLPPIAGYLVAGLIIGPNTPGGSADVALASDLAEIGVILLMFGVGLHFSVRELTAVGSIAIPGTLIHSAFATLLGVGATQLWGWSLTEGLILGLCLSISSTVVLLRALEDRNLLETQPGRVAVGWLIAEDLFTIVVLVLLPALAGEEASEGGLLSKAVHGGPVMEVTLAMSQTAIFATLMLVLGARALPRLLSEVVRAGSRELFTLSILALALGLAYGSAELFGSSLALGAFLAGIVLNESELSYRAGLEALPLRDAFAVLFFVSVGMIFEPSILVDEPLQVALVTTIIVIGKSIPAFLIVTFFGYGLRTALTSAAALSQIGEFSFILAALAGSLDLLPESANSLILAGAIISIIINPFFFMSIDRMEMLLSRFEGLRRFAGRRMPETETLPQLRRHLVICGYGRAGASLARALEGRHLPYVIVENDALIYERARAAGLSCVFGDASQSIVLQQAQVAEARAIAVTFDSQPTAPLTVRNARNLNPGIDVVTRGFGPESHGLLRQSGADEVVDPTFEASLEFVRHVLHRYGVDGREIAVLQSRWRSEYYGSR